MFQQYGFKYYIVYCIVAIVASKVYFIEKLLTYYLQNPLRYLGVIGIFHRCVSSVFITYVGILRSRFLPRGILYDLRFVRPFNATFISLCVDSVT